MATLPPRRFARPALNQKGKRFGFPSVAIGTGAGDESRTRDLNLGKATAAPSYTATRRNVTLIRAELRKDLLEDMSTCQSYLAQGSFAHQPKLFLALNDCVGGLTNFFIVFDSVDINFCI